VLEHKSDIPLKRVKVEEKLLCRAYRNSPTVFRSYHPDPYSLLFPKIGGSHPHPKTQNSNRYYLTNGYSYGLQIWLEHSKGPSEQKLFKILAKRERERIWDCRNFLGTPSYLNFKFCAHFHSINRKKSPLKIWSKVAVGVVRDSRKFSGHSY